MAGLCRLALAAAVLSASASALPVQQAPVADTVRARLHAYLSTYEHVLGTLIAEERLQQWPMKQRLLNNGGLTPDFVRDASRIKTLTSDVAFVTLPGNAGWLGYRNVRRIGDREVRRRGPSLEELLKATSEDARERAMLLLLESARHNLGAPRTINLPSMPLELLHQRNQARYVIDTSSGDRVGDCRAMRLDLSETARPSIIQRPDGGDMPTSVSAWVEPETGRLCKAEVRIRDGRLGVPEFTAVVSVEFARSADLDLTVPSRMQEVFFIAPRGRGESEATYSNYRRFTTSGRLVPGSD